MGAASFAQRVGDDMMDRLRLIGQQWEFDEHDVLFRQGDPVDDVMIIEAGLVSVHVLDEPAELTLGVYGRGDLLGEMSALERGPRAASGVAYAPGMVTIVSGPRFRAFLKVHPDAMGHALGVVLHRVRRAYQERDRTSAATRGARADRTPGRAANRVPSRAAHRAAGRAIDGERGRRIGRRPGRAIGRAASREVGGDQGREPDREPVREVNRDAAVRVARTILLWARHFGAARAGGAIVVGRMSRRDLAKAAAVPENKINDALHSLRAAGLLDVQRRRLVLPSAGRLRTWADGGSADGLA